MRVLALLCFLGLTLPATAEASRIREICDVSGVRENQLIGYGLVVGLANTGDTAAARFTLQAVAAMLRRLGATIDPALVQTRNAAAVMVIANLPGGARPGTRIDVTVSSLGNARSLAGGILLQTPLLGADGSVYAAAQGSLIVGAFGASGASGSSTTLNHLTTGRVPTGAIVERTVPGSDLPTEGPIVLTLRDPSFITARRVATAIEGLLGDGMARPIDAGSIEVTVPVTYEGNRVGLLADVQALEVELEAPARIVLDERTGTVVIGAGVRLRPAAVAHGGLVVEIRESTEIAAVAPIIGDAATATAPESEVGVTDLGGALHTLGDASTLEDVVAALNALGATPRDLVAILQALHTAGAIEGELELE
jgi:flagellar P-ring protein precursor FlgI